jgi:hypothetical protein
MQQPPKKKKWWSFGRLRTAPLIEVTLTTDVPIDVAIQKLRGFVTDHEARIVSTRENHNEMENAGDTIGQARRRGDRPDMYRVELELGEKRLEKTNNVGLAKGSYAVSTVEVVIRPRRNRNRRQGDQSERARLILQRLKAYLMAKEINPQGDEAELAGAH